MSKAIPPEVLGLVRLDTPVSNVRASDNHCYLTTLGLELRFVRSIDNSWEWDEVVGPCRVHVEMMADNYYWIGFDTDEGRVCVDIGARRAPVRMTGWTESYAEPLERGDQ